MLALDDFKCLRKDLKRDLRKWRKNHEHSIVHSGSVKKVYNYINSKLRNTHSSIKL